MRKIKERQSKKRQNYIENIHMLMCVSTGVYVYVCEYVAAYADTCLLLIISKYVFPVLVCVCVCLTSSKILMLVLDDPKLQHVSKTSYS